MTGLYVDDNDTVPFGNSPVPVSKCSVDCSPGQWKRPLVSIVTFFSLLSLKVQLAQGNELIRVCTTFLIYFINC